MRKDKAHIQQEQQRTWLCRFVEDEPKPAQLPNTFWGWILPVWRASQQEVIAVAGTDGAVYLMMLKFGASPTPYPAAPPLACRSRDSQATTPDGNASRHCLIFTFASMFVNALQGVQVQ